MTLFNFKKMIPLLCIIAGSLVTVIAGFFDYQNKLSDKDEQINNERIRTKEAEKLLTKSNTILIKTEGIINSQQLVIKNSDEIIKLQNKLTESYKLNAELQKEFKNLVTGGDTKPLLSVWPHKEGEAFIINFLIINHGKYPLNNVKCLINDMPGIALSPFVETKLFRSFSKSTTIPKLTEEESYKNWTAEHSFDIGALNINTTLPIYSAALPLSNSYNGHFLPYYGQGGEGFYRVIIDWNNGNLDYFVTVMVEKDKLILKKIEVTYKGNQIDSNGVFKFAE